MAPGIEGWYLGFFRKLIAKLVFHIETEKLHIFGIFLTIAELQGRRFANDHIYSGCKRTKESSASRFFNLSKQQERGQKRGIIMSHVIQN